VTITLGDGRRFHVFVEHAVGSLERPLDDAALARKFDGLVEPVLGTGRAKSLRDAVATLGRTADLRPLFAALSSRAIPARS